MKRPVTFLFLFQFKLLVAFSQVHVVTGSILAAGSSNPISEATIYISGTSKGTISDHLGQFKLSGVSLPGELVISHVGYKLQSYPLADPSILDALIFSLEPAVYELEAATVTGEDLRNQYLKDFKKWFLGQNYKTLDADILNDSILIFNILENGQFDVSANGPVQVTLPRIGYEVQVDLFKFGVRFNSELNSHQCSFLGHYYFVPVEVRSRRKAHQIERKRAIQYYGSRKHFCRSWYHNALAENGYHMYGSWNCSPKTTTAGDTIPDYIQTYGKDPFGNPLLRVTDFRCGEHRIVYYSVGVNRPAERTSKDFHYSSFTMSPMWLVNDTIKIYPSGRVPENCLLFGGAIGNQGVASMLPEDYIPSMQ